MNFKDIVITAKLNNGKRIVINPNMLQANAHYRYMTEEESKDNQLKVFAKYIWLETPIFTTVEAGETLVFCQVEGTPIILNRF